jgi:hypothetical protein
MRFHKRHDLRRVGSASWAKNALANLKISLVRFSSAFSLRSRFSWRRSGCRGGEGPTAKLGAA